MPRMPRDFLKAGARMASQEGLWRPGERDGGARALAPGSKLTARAPETGRPQKSPGALRPA